MDTIGYRLLLNSIFNKITSQCPSRITTEKMTKIITNLVKRLVFNYLTYFKNECLVNLFYYSKPTEFNDNSFLACKKHYYKNWAENYLVIFNPISINYSLVHLQPFGWIQVWEFTLFLIENFFWMRIRWKQSRPILARYSIIIGNLIKIAGIRVFGLK